MLIACGDERYCSPFNSGLLPPHREKQGQVRGANCTISIEISGFRGTCSSPTREKHRKIRCRDGAVAIKVDLHHDAHLSEGAGRNHSARDSGTFPSRDLARAAAVLKELDAIEVISRFNCDLASAIDHAVKTIVVHNQLTINIELRAVIALG